MLRILLAALLAACSSSTSPVDDANPCPDEAQFGEVNGTPCDQPAMECRSARCADPCVECVLLVCQQRASTYVWELNSQAACECGDTPPACVDPVTCQVIDGCS